MDTNNKRIVKWPLGSNYGEVAAYISSINEPRSMYFTINGNLIVTDMVNHAVLSSQLQCREYSSSV